MLGLCMKDGKVRLTPMVQYKVHRSLPVIAFIGGAVILVLAAVAFVRAQSSFPRDSQLMYRRPETITRADAIDDLRERLFLQSERITKLDDKLSVIERSMEHIEGLKLDVVMDRQNNFEQQAKDDAVERRALRTLLITTSVSFAVVLFSSWWNRRNSGVK